MLKGAKRKRSRTLKGKRKALTTKVQSIAPPNEMNCVIWTSHEIKSKTKITGFFHHVNLDHDYVFKSPIAITGINIPGSRSAAITYTTHQGNGLNFSLSTNGDGATVKRAALKPAKKCQKPEESNNKSITDYFPVRRSLRKTLVKMKKEKIRDIEDAILSGSEDGYEIRDFFGKGRGVVTTKPLKQGDFVLEYFGDLLTREEAKLREYMYAQDENVGCYMYYFTYNNKQFCVDATRESGRLGRLVNHCKKGNLGTKIFLVKDRPHLILVAKQDINSGQELLYDYGDRSKRSLEWNPWLAS